MGSNNSGDPGTRKRAAKEGQKNVSVYLGSKGGWQSQVLAAICNRANQTESEFFRNLFLAYLSQYGAYDADRGEPNLEAIEKIKAKCTTDLLPSLDE